MLERFLYSRLSQSLYYPTVCWISRERVWNVLWIYLTTEPFYSLGNIFHHLKELVFWEAVWETQEYKIHTYAWSNKVFNLPIAPSHPADQENNCDWQLCAFKFQFCLGLGCRGPSGAERWWLCERSEVLPNQGALQKEGAVWVWGVQRGREGKSFGHQCAISLPPPCFVLKKPCTHTHT